jgi:large repetitive protein
MRRFLSKSLLPRLSAGRRARFLPLLGILVLPLFCSNATCQSIRSWGALVFDSAWSQVTDFATIAAGSVQTLAVRSGGSIVAIGDNRSGECIVPPLPASVRYLAVAAGGRDIGYGHVLALRSDGIVVAWGDNHAQQCNVPALPPGVIYVGVAAGMFHSLALRSDGSAVAWGGNGFGEASVPALPPGLSYTQVAADGNHSVALRADGVVLAWGDNR